MRKGKVLGYDLNEKYCQITYYDENKNEPETVEVSPGNYQIPLALGYCDDEWIYGKSAQILAKMNDENVITDLLEKAMRREKIVLAGKRYDAVWLLAKFISLTLEKFEDIKVITFTSAVTDVDMSKMMKAIGRNLGLSKDDVHVQDYKESFCYFMFYQPFFRVVVDIFAVFYIIFLVSDYMVEKGCLPDVFADFFIAQSLKTRNCSGNYRICRAWRPRHAVKIIDEKQKVYMVGHNDIFLNRNHFDIVY